MHVREGRRGQRRKRDFDVVTSNLGQLRVRNIADIDRYLGQVREAAAKIHASIATQTGEPLELRRRMKFEAAVYLVFQTERKP